MLLSGFAARSRGHLLAQRQADQKLPDRLRVQDRKEIEWAKIRNEEWSPFRLLADWLRIGGLVTF
jgi:hypothetical protein